MEIKGYKENGGLCPVCGLHTIFPVYIKPREHLSRYDYCQPVQRDLSIERYSCIWCNFSASIQPFCFFMNLDGSDNEELRKRFDTVGVLVELIY